ncbi:MAG: hypothetical protein JW870_07310 [Candidatus Delongbacteria bacterium]|nr:hypothetical protein [Candidatus Delongbacteria bacterium]
MSKSYEKIDYNLRPAKCTERKIIIDIIRSFLDNQNFAKDYQYIGFGSIFYNDFRLFHKNFGIKEMICIESEKDDADRFKFNLPYKSIDLIMEHSSDAINQINWDKKTIIWLDYDLPMEKSMLDDIFNTFSFLKDNSIFIFSCNRSFQRYFDSNSHEYNVNKFKNDFGDYTPFRIKPSDLTMSNSHKMLSNLIEITINSSLKERNSIIKNDINKLNFEKLFKFNYADGAPMFTVGGIISLKENLKRIQIKKRKLYFPGKDNFNIETPLITNKEMTLLNSKLPNTFKRFSKYKAFSFIPDKYVESYYNLYRYLSIYSEIIEK